MVESSNLNRLFQQIGQMYHSEDADEKIDLYLAKKKKAQEKANLKSDEFKNPNSGFREKDGKDIAKPINGEVTLSTPPGLELKSVRANSSGPAKEQKEMRRFGLTSQEEIIDGVKIIKSYNQGKVTHVIVEMGRNKHFIFNGEPSPEELKKKIESAKLLMTVAQKAREKRELMGSNHSEDLTRGQAPIAADAQVSLAVPDGLQKVKINHKPGEQKPFPKPAGEIKLPRSSRKLTNNKGPVTQVPDNQEKPAGDQPQFTMPRRVENLPKRTIKRKLADQPHFDLLAGSLVGEMKKHGGGLSSFTKPAKHFWNKLTNLFYKD